MRVFVTLDNTLPMSVLISDPVVTRLSMFLTHLTGCYLRLECCSQCYLATSKASLILALWRAICFVPFEGAFWQAAGHSAPVQQRQSIRIEDRVRCQPLRIVYQPAIQTVKFGAAEIEMPREQNKRTQWKWQKDKKIGTGETIGHVISSPCSRQLNVTQNH
jgi:hypothetical protein